MKDISLKTWIVTIVAGVIAIVCCMFVYKIYDVSNLKDALEVICNSCFATGFIFLCIGLLAWCSNHGAFTGLSYSFKQLFEKRRFEKAFNARERYGDYRARRLEKQAKFIHLIIVGGSILVISIILYIIWECC